MERSTGNLSSMCNCCALQVNPAGRSTGEETHRGPGVYREATRTYLRHPGRRLRTTGQFLDHSLVSRSLSFNSDFIISFISIGQSRQSGICA